MKSRIAEPVILLAFGATLFVTNVAQARLDVRCCSGNPPISFSLK